MKAQTIIWRMPKEILEEWKDGRSLLCRLRNELGSWCEILYYDNEEETFCNDNCEIQPEENIELVVDLEELSKD